MNRPHLTGLTAMSLVALHAADGIIIAPVKPAPPAPQPLSASPSQQLKEINAQQEQRHGYRPHVGAKQKAKALKKLGKARSRGLKAARWRRWLP